MSDNDLQPLIDKIRRHAEISDRDAVFPVCEFEWIRNAGLLSAPLTLATLVYKEKLTEYLVEILRKIGTASLPVGRIFEGHVNAMQLISVYGNAEQKSRYFELITQKQFLMSVWNTQDTDGVSIQEIGAGKYRLKGSKTFCSGATWIQLPLITAELVSAKTKGWQMCIIPNEKIVDIKADASQWQPLGMRTSASFKMDFTGIVLEQKDLLGPVDSYYKQPYFSGGAVRFTAVQLGASQAILEETHRFLKVAGRAGDPFQKARLAEMSFLVETGNLWVKKVARLTDMWQNSPHRHQRLLAYVNMGRMVVGKLCVKCMQLAEESVGVRGMLKPHPLERIHRDLTTYLKQPAPDAAMLSIGQYVFDQPDISSLWAEI